MKKSIIFVIAMSLASVANAAHDGNGVASLSHFVDQGKIHLSAGIESSLSHTENHVEGFGNIKTNNDKYKGYALDLEAQYGVMKDMSASVESKFNLNRRMEVTPNSGGTAERFNETKGFSDPTIGAKYRCMHGNWTNDTFVKWETEFTEKTLTDSTNAGNAFVVNGTGQTFNVGTTMYTDLMEGVFGITPYIKLSTGADWQNVVNNRRTGTKTVAKYTSDASFGYGLDVNYRRHYDKFYTQLGVKLMAKESYTSTANSLEVTSGSTTATTTLKNVSVDVTNPWIVTPKIVFGYMLTDSSTVDATFGYSNYKFDSKTTSNSATSSKENVTVKDISMVLAYGIHI